MARPMKERKVCCMPETNLFGPLNRRHSLGDEIVMTVEEYETIRLIDQEGLMQEECADRMDVARTTVQRIYISARKKIADAIVEGMTLKIEGGSYKLCAEEEQDLFFCKNSRIHRPRRNRYQAVLRNQE